ncbi:MAG: SAM-dependent methyltransferase [Bdellovibrio sp.]|nr:MAG: SAM-dependent methyltransferase [Bdellovibrio sp.]
MISLPRDVSSAKSEPSSWRFKEEAILFLSRFYSERVFPYICDCLVRNRRFDQRRRTILQFAHGNILELGIGTGRNLKFYPPGVREIVAIDPSVGMESLLWKKSLKQPESQRIKIRFHRGSAEELPFRDHSFDTVVSTITLCSIGNLNKALREIRRVLKRDGEFLFLDHGLSPDPSVAAWQSRLDPVEKVVACGCSLVVDVEKELLNAGFRIVDLKKYYLPAVPKVLGHLFEGRARPREGDVQS